MQTTVSSAPADGVNFADPAVFAWQSEGQVQAEGVFVLRLSDHLSPLLTGPKFFPALGDEGDEEEVDHFHQGGKEGASVFQSGASSVLAEGKVRRAKGSQTSYARCTRPRLKDGGSDDAGPQNDSSLLSSPGKSRIEVPPPGLESRGHGQAGVDGLWYPLDCYSKVRTG